MNGFARAPDHGFTLVEVLIALVLFSLIGTAGFSLLNAIVGVQARTEQRLERLAELQRAMHLLAMDLQQIADVPIAVDGSSALFSRRSDTTLSGTMTVRYDLDQQTVRRTLSGTYGGPGREQALLARVESLRWLFFDPAAGWTESWPPVGAAENARPEAVAAEMTIGDAGGGLSGIVRRVVRLPARAKR